MPKGHGDERQTSKQMLFYFENAPSEAQLCGSVSRQFVGQLSQLHLWQHSESRIERAPVDCLPSINLGSSLRALSTMISKPSAFLLPTRGNGIFLAINGCLE